MVTSIVHKIPHTPSCTERKRRLPQLEPQVATTSAPTETQPDAIETLHTMGKLLRHHLFPIVIDGLSYVARGSTLPCHL